MKRIFTIICGAILALAAAGSDFNGVSRAIAQTEQNYTLGASEIHEIRLQVIRFLIVGPPFLGNPDL